MIVARLFSKIYKTGGIILIDASGQKFICGNPETSKPLTLRILKNRYTGDTGIATHLHYNKDTGRMKEIDNPYEVDYNAENNTEEVPF